MNLLMPHFPRSLLCVLQLMLSWSLACLLAGPIARATEGQVASGPLAEMTVNAPDGALRIDDQWILPVTIKNVGQVSLTVKQVGWEMPVRLTQTRAPRPGDGPTSAVKPDGGSLNSVPLNITHPEWFAGDQLGATTSRDLTHSQDVLLCRLVMPSIQATGAKIGTNFSLLFWRSEEIPIVVNVVCTSEAGTVALRQTLKVRFVPSAMTMIYGGLAGSVLAMVFFFAYRTAAFVKRWADGERATKGEVANPEAEKPGRVVFWEGLSATVQVEGAFSIFRTCAGMVTVLILLLFLSTGNTSMLPISLTVNDFLGAALMGLFSHKLGEWVFDALFGDAPIPGTKPLREETNSSSSTSSARTPETDPVGNTNETAGADEETAAEPTSSSSSGRANS